LGHRRRQRHGRCVAHELAALGATVILTGAQRRQAAAGGRRNQGRRRPRRNAAFDIRDEEGTGAPPCRRQSAATAASTACQQCRRSVSLAADGISKKGFDTVIANNLTAVHLMRGSLQSMQNPTGGAI